MTFFSATTFFPFSHESTRSTTHAPRLCRGEQDVEGGAAAFESANIPASETICITHNDFRFDNVVLDRDDPTRIIHRIVGDAVAGDPAPALAAQAELTTTSRRKQPKRNR